MYYIHCMLHRSLITGELSVICGWKKRKKNIRMLHQGQDYFRLPTNVPHFLQKQSITCAFLVDTLIFNSLSTNFG